MNRVISWPGAKYRQLSDIMALLPDRDWNAVCEPFLGAGAFSWHMLENHKIESLMTAEANNNLRTWWLHLLEDPEFLVEEMSRVREQFTGVTADRDIFNELRDGYNVSFAENPLSVTTSAKLWVLIYASTNNLARFNLSGGYNQTFGKGRTIPDPKKVFGEIELDLVRSFRKASPFWVLPGVRVARDFVPCLDVFIDVHQGNENSIVFLDPPYYIRTETYQKGCWTLDHETRLFDIMRLMDELWVPWVMTN